MTKRSLEKDLVECERNQSSLEAALRAEKIESQKLAEQLARSEEFVRATVDALSAHLAILDERGTIVAVNKAWDTFAGENSKKPGFWGPGVNYLEVCRNALGEGQKDAIAIAAGIEAVIKGDRAEFTLEYPCHAPNQKRWFVARVTRFPGEGPVKVVVNHTNITLRREVERQLSAAKEAAEIATREKSEFLANMSHEIRTPITAIIGFADIMLDPDQTESERIDGLQTIRRNARYLLELINEILDVSKIEAGRMTVEKIATELPALLSDVVSLMRPRAAEKGIELTLQFRGTVPRCVVSDPVRVQQILMNLVSNAIKFTEKGRVQICASFEAVQQMLSFEVSDTGIGISEAQLSRLFQAFIQADGSTTRRFGGTGLGLTISRHLAQLLGGDISVCSVSGTGSTFTARIAAPDAGGGEYCLVKDALITPATGPGQVYEMLSGRVLLAEDGKDNQLFISTMLRKAGAEVVIADNGRLAVDKALADEFDLVLMDMQMPELDGYAATIQLRGCGFSKPIIALTAHAMADDRAKCLKAGCSDYLTKPIDRRLLIEIAGRYLKQSPTALPVPTADALPAASTENIQSTCADDPVMAEILPVFINYLPGQVAAISALLNDQDLGKLRSLVHQMKGAGGSYGFKCLTEAAARAESSLRDNDTLETIKLQVEALIKLVRRVQGYDASREVVGLKRPDDLKPAEQARLTSSASHSS